MDTGTRIEQVAVGMTIQYTDSFGSVWTGTVGKIKRVTALWYVRMDTITVVDRTGKDSPGRPGYQRWLPVADVTIVR